MRTCFGIGEPGDPQFTISAAHSHGVCYAVSTDGKSKADATKELVPTLTVTKKSKCTAVCYRNTATDVLAFKERAGKPGGARES